MLSLTRADLERAFNGDRKLIAAFEELFTNVRDVGNAQALNVESTKDLQDATVLTLSSNDTLNNERVVQQGRGIALSDTGSALIIALAYNIVVNGGYRMTFNTSADTDVTFQTSGTPVMEETPLLRYLNDYATDTAAASGGVPVNGLYRTGNALKVRLT